MKSRAVEWAPGQADLEAFRALQRTAYECAVEVGAGLTAGVTEREAAARLRRLLEARGADEWFHLPFAWFGDRTAFRRFVVPLQFFPTERRLEPGMPFILDCAPVVRGVTVDIGYSGSLGANPLVERLLDDLAAHRALILDLVRRRRSLRDVYRAVDSLLREQGHDNRHAAYPGRVIAHQVWRLPETGRSSRTLFGFGVRNLARLGRTLAQARRAGWSPLWAGGRASDHPPRPGLWAVEPHLGHGAVGAKFEEILVVTETDAYWLDDQLPHVTRRNLS